MPREALPRVISYSSGLDYLSLSSPKNPTAHSRFVTIGNHVIKTLEARGEEIVRPGIRGYRGVKVGGVTFANRTSDNHYRLVAEGPIADEIADMVIDAGIDAPCTRVDPKVIYELDKGMQFYGDFLHRQIRSFERRNGITERTPFTLYEKEKQDTGLTLGHRSSAIYPRIYDQELYHAGTSQQRVWAAEIETKEEAAQRNWMMIQQTNDRGKLCLDWVATRMKNHGICPKGLEHAERVEMVGTRPRSDWERYFKWFKSTVIPSMDKRSGQGHFTDIRDALEAAGFIDGDGVFIRPCET